MAKVSEVFDTPDKFGQVISYLTATVPTFATLVSGGEEQRVVVAAIESEPLADVTERVRRSGGDAIIVALRSDPDNAERVRLVIGRMKIRDHAAGSGDHPVPFDVRCSLGDLLMVLGEGATITLRQSDELEVLELVDIDAPEVEISGESLAFVK
jgi:hypothetical protein